jgi:hypothetical protein
VYIVGRAIAQAITCRLFTASAQVRDGVSYCGICGGQGGIGAGFFSKYFGFPCQFAYHRLIRIHHYLSSGADTIGQTVAAVPSGLMAVSPHEREKDVCILYRSVAIVVVVD